MKCNSCNHINKDSALFCVECGSPFYKKCPNCNTDSLVSYKFCPNCGGAFDMKLDALNRYKRKLVFFESVYTYGKVGSLVLVKRNKLYGIFNYSTLTLILPCEFESYDLFTKDYVFLRKNNNWYMYHPLTGSLLCDDSFEEVRNIDYQDFVQVKRKGLWGILSLSSRSYAIYPQYLKFAYAGYGRKVLAEKDGLWGCVEYSDNFNPICTIPFEYLSLDTAEFEDCPRPSQHKNQKWGVIRSNGKKLISFEYDEIEYHEPFGRSLYYLRKGNSWGMFRSGGRFDEDVFLPCDYTKERIKELWNK